MSWFKRQWLRMFPPILHVQWVDVVEELKGGEFRPKLKWSDGRTTTCRGSGTVFHAEPHGARLGTSVEAMCCDAVVAFKWWRENNARNRVPCRQAVSGGEECKDRCGYCVYCEAQV